MMGGTRHRGAGQAVGIMGVVAHIIVTTVTCAAVVYASAAPDPTDPCDSAPGGQCADYSDVKEMLIHPSLKFEHHHSGNLCLGLIPDCTQRTNHPTICSRTSFGVCNGAAKPKASLNMETVGLVAVSDSSTPEEGGEPADQMPPFFDYKRAKCTWRQILDLECWRMPPEGSTDQPTLLAAGDQPWQSRIGSGFQNVWHLADGKKSYDAHMAGTFMEDAYGFNYIGLKFSLNEGETDIVDKTMSVAYPTYDSMVGMWDRAGSEAENAEWDAGYANLKGRAPFTAQLCTADAAKDGQCDGVGHIIKSKDIAMSFFFFNSGDVEVLPQLYKDHGMTHAVFRAKIWSPEGLGTAAGLKVWQSLLINGNPVDGLNHLDNVKNISLDNGNLAFVFPDTYNYGTVNNVTGDFVPQGRDTPFVFATIQEAVKGSGVATVFLDYHVKLEHCHKKDQYVLYEADITNRYGDKAPTPVDEVKPPATTHADEVTPPATTTPADEVTPPATTTPADEVTPPATTTPEDEVKPPVTGTTPTKPTDQAAPPGTNGVSSLGARRCAADGIALVQAVAAAWACAPSW